MYSRCAPDCPGVDIVTLVVIVILIMMVMVVECMMQVNLADDLFIGNASPRW